MGGETQAAPRGPAQFVPLRPYKPLRGRGEAVLALLAALAGVFVLTALADALYLGELSAYDDDDTWDVAYDTGPGTFFGVMAVLQGLLYIAAAVIFIVWFFAAYGNLQPLGMLRPRFGQGWAIGAWFIPIFNWIRPKQIANDIWRAGDPDAPPHSDPGWFGEPVPRWINLWWALWIVTGVLGNGVGRLSWRSDTVADERTAVIVDLVGTPFYIAAALLAMRFVTRTTERQEHRVSRLTQEAAQRPERPATFD